MIKHLNISRSVRSLALASAGLVLTSTAAFAVTPAVQATQDINAKLPAGVTLVRTRTTTAATQDQVDVAVKLVLADNSVPATLISTVATVGTRFAPSFSPDIVNAALARLNTDSGSLTTVLFNHYANAIVIAGMRNALLHGGALTDKANAAAAVTSVAVAQEKANTGLLPSLVTTAVHFANTFAHNSIRSNGAAGAVTGAISQTAGVSNADVTNNDGDDVIVKAVITAAARGAASQFSAIASAVGYAFAATYLETTPSGAVSESTFQGTNDAALVAALEAGLPAPFTHKFGAKILSQIDAGIMIAFNTPNGGPGAAGVADFTFNNGNGSPVTDVQGL